MTKYYDEAITKMQASRKRLVLTAKSGDTRSLTFLLFLLLSTPALCAQQIKKLNVAVATEHGKKLTVNCLNAKNANFKCEAHFNACPDVPGLNLREQTANPCDCKNSLWVQKGTETDSGVNQDSLVFSTNCKDNSIESTPTNPFHGWWSTISKGNNEGYDPTGISYLNDDIDAYIFIDTTKTPISISTTGGTNLQPRELTNLDSDRNLDDGFDPAFVTYDQVDATTLIGRYNLLEQTGSDFNQFPDSFALKLQVPPMGDGKTIIATEDSNPFSYGDTFATKLVKVKEPKLRPFGESDVNFKGDVNDPVFLFKYIFDQLLHMGNPQNAHFACDPSLVIPGANCVTCDPAIPQPLDCDFVGFREAYEILNQFLTTGLTFTTPITKIRPTSSYSASQGQFVTDIYTNAFAYALPGSTVTIAGFTGAYAALNGTYVNGVAVRQSGGIPNPSSLHVDYAATNDVQTAGTFAYHFLLGKDTSDAGNFPRVTGNVPTAGQAIFNPTDNPTVTVTHKVHSSMEYPEFAASVYAMFFKIWRVALHFQVGIFRSPQPSPQPLFLYDNWQDLQAAVKAGAVSGNLNVRVNITLPSVFYHNPALAPESTRAQNYLFNDPFNLRPNASGVWPELYDYDIVLNNYLEKEDVKNLYWALSGTPTGPWIDVQQNVQSNFGYKQNVDPSITGGKTFVGAIAPYFNASGQDNTYNLDINTYTLYAGSLSLAPSDLTIRTNKNDFYFGRVKKSLTGNKNVGYLRLRDFAAPDPAILMGTGFFDPTNGASPKFGHEALSQVLSVMMKYLVTDLQSDTIIIDIRGNRGGELGFAIPEFIGSTRPSTVGHQSYKDDGVRLNDMFQDTTKYSTANNVLAITAAQLATLWVDFNKTQYPGSVFENGKIIILTDTLSASEGDLFPNFFLGTNLDKNLGAGVTVQIVGEIDGRLKGGESAPNPMPVSKNSSFLTDADGNPVSPIVINYDAEQDGLVYQLGGTNYYTSQQTPVTAIDPAPIKGTAGGNPLPNDWPEVLWPDLGFVPYPYPGTLLPGQGSQNPLVQSTWTDTWLNQAILVS